MMVKAQDRVKVTDSNDAEVVAGENAQGGFGSGLVGLVDRALAVVMISA